MGIVKQSVSVWSAYQYIRVPKSRRLIVAPAAWTVMVATLACVEEGVERCPLWVMSGNLRCTNPLAMSPCSGLEFELLYVPKKNVGEDEKLATLNRIKTRMSMRKCQSVQ
jgi:hypothetical protein